MVTADAPLSGRVAAVTGGGKGIGWAIALRLAADGAAVLVADIDEPAATATAAQIIAGSGQAIALAADVSTIEGATAITATAVTSFGRLDILVNNAGVIVVKDPLELTVAEWDRIFAVNVRGSFLCAQAAARHMLARGGGGRIVNISSIAGLRSGPVTAAYGASKHAVIGLTQALAQAWGRAGITVNAVCPGTVETPLWAGMDAGFRAATGQSAREVLAERAARSAQGWLQTAEDVAAAVAFLCRDEARSINGDRIVVAGEPV
jgi:meso-butanediol dehydrogenase/(S,S)-butanediol dehydrogenase/diacetyl reductase